MEISKIKALQPAYIELGKTLHAQRTSRANDQRRDEVAVKLFFSKKKIVKVKLPTGKEITA